MIDENCAGSGHAPVSSSANICELSASIESWFTAIAKCYSHRKCILTQCCRAVQQSENNGFAVRTRLVAAVVAGSLNFVGAAAVASFEAAVAAATELYVAAVLAAAELWLNNWNSLNS